MTRNRTSHLREVIARATAVLRSLRDNEAGLTPAEIAARVHLPIEDTRQLLLALETNGLTTTTGSPPRVQLGPAFLRVAASLGSRLIEIANPIVARLSHELRETVDVSILQDNAVLFIHQIVGPQRLRAVSAVGECFPLHCTANGKAILAQLDSPEVLRLVPETLQAFTTNTIRSRQALISELEKVRQSKVGFDIGEHTLGICAIGAALHDVTMHHLAISVPLPSVRFYDNRDSIAARLLSARDELQERMIETRALAEWH